jgi:hypothetical protein
MTNERNELAIRALIDDWTDAICRGDIGRVLTEQTISSCTTRLSRSR